MSDNNAVLAAWQAQYEEGKGYLQYPNEALVIAYHRFKHLLPEQVTCLDYGFGSGNNSAFLLPMVDQFYGLEISQAAKEMAGKRLQALPNFSADNLKVVNNQLVESFVDQFDIVVAWHVLSYNQHESLNAAIERIGRYLKPGGLLITTLATREDISFIYGIAQDSHRNDFVLSEQIPSQQGCQVIIPENAEDFESYFSPVFSTLDIGVTSRHSFKLMDRHEHFYGVFQKR